jgi:hypothetical protein
MQTNKIRTTVPQTQKIYRRIIRAVKRGDLKEPFNGKMFKKACPGFADRTYKTFLPKHRKSNTTETRQLFIRIAPGFYKVIRPYHYGIT